MSRQYIDCREFPSEANCTVAIAADDETELLEAAAQHATAVHGHADSPQLRDQLRHLIRDGTPPEASPLLNLPAVAQEGAASTPY